MEQSYAQTKDIRSSRAEMGPNANLSQVRVPNAGDLKSDSIEFSPEEVNSIILSSHSNSKLSMEAFHQLAGNLAGYPYVKVLLERKENKVHFINHHSYSFHAEYIAAEIFKITREELVSKIDQFNKDFYLKEDREFFLGVLAFHRKESEFFSLETVEIDNLGSAMMIEFYQALQPILPTARSLLFKPANHQQEEKVRSIPVPELPRIYHHELFEINEFSPLNEGKTRGRLRLLKSEKEFEAKISTFEWYDILVMNRVPDSIPRISGIINSDYTTPLSHTNVLASGWGIPNAIQLGILEDLSEKNWDGRWVTYEVERKDDCIGIQLIEGPVEVPQKPDWIATRVRMEEPDTEHVPICRLDELRVRDHYRYGTKASNIGELIHLLEAGSKKLKGFFKVPRPPRSNLMSHLAERLDVSESKDLDKEALQFLRNSISIPKGISIPFSVQKDALEVSPAIQQSIGKLKMAIELDAELLDTQAIRLQQLIRALRIEDSVRDSIDDHMIENLSGISQFVVRSSSNAEDLQDFSASGIYESITHCHSVNEVFEAIQEVWASLVSPRSIQLRKQVGIPLDHTYMGVIVQEKIEAEMGGVLVTKNPMNPTDFRNVYINVSKKGPSDVVSGGVRPYQYLFNTVEGGGRTVSLGSNSEELSAKQMNQLEKLALVGRLLQGHFSKDYTFSAPLDIEWAASNDTIWILQLRPYAG